MPSIEKILSKTLDLITVYHADHIARDGLVVEYKDPQTLSGLLQLEIDPDGVSYEELFDEIGKYLRFCVRTGNKQFFNQLYAGFNTPAFLGEIFTALTNTSMYTYEVAPVATLMEQTLIRKMCGIVGYPDGAFGRSLILASAHKHLFKGLARADSFAWNPHKLMNVPLICSTLLLKNRGTLERNLTDLDSDYLFHESESRNFDIGKLSVQCGRRADSLKLWLAWKYYGDNGYRKRMDNLFEIANYFARRVREDGRLELMAEPQSITVCFRYLPADNSDINGFNLRLRDELRMSGKSMVNYGYIGKNVAIRFIAANAEMETTDIDRFFEHLFSTAEDLMHKTTTIS